VATGFLLVVAYHQTVRTQPESGRLRTGLVNDVHQRHDDTERLQRTADQLRDEVAKERDAALAGTGDGGILSRLELATGTNRVRGSGAVVRLVDAPTQVDPVTGKPTGKNYGLVLDRDLQDVTNELWHGGAEAIAINGERLTATSTIRKAGSTILVDFRPIASPYEVAAIGPDDLDQRFTESVTGARIRALVNRYGMQVTVRHENDLTLSPAPDPQLNYARQVPSASPTPRPSGSGPSPVPSSPGGR
jgi:uncharacterized protein YlxW (UPF0749 family)